MFTKFKYLLICFFMIASVSCSKNQKVEQSLDKIPTRTEYGIWNLKNNVLESKRAGITIKFTDIYEKEEKARIFLKSDYMLAEKPKFKIYGLEDFDIELNGQGDEFSFELPISIIDQARMFLNETFVEVAYRIKGADYYRKSIFSLKDVPEAIKDIRKKNIKNTY